MPKPIPRDYLSQRDKNICGGGYHGRKTPFPLYLSPRICSLLSSTQNGQQQNLPNYPHQLTTPMSSDIDSLTVNYEEDGTLLVKELDKVILSKGAWTTILFRYQNWNKSKGEYSQDMYTIRRYQKKGGAYLTKSKFNISSPAQAEKIVETLNEWLK